MTVQAMQPIILIGAGRSGTKFLRDCLASSPEVARVPYDVSYVWRTGNDTVPHDELTVADAARAPASVIRRTLEKMARSEGKVNARFMVEKSVPNALRPAFVAAVMPDAKFVHLIRDGRSVTESALRMWRGPREAGHILRKLKYFPLANYRYALWYAGNLAKSRLAPGREPPMWGPRYEGIGGDLLKQVPLVRICARQWRRCIEISRAELGQLPKKQVFEIRYEDLIQSAANIEELCRFIGIADPGPVVAALQRDAAQDTVSKWRKSMSQTDIDAMLDEVKPLLSELGYT